MTFKVNNNYRIRKKSPLIFGYSLIVKLTMLILGISMIMPFIYMGITSLKVTYTAYDFGLSFDSLTLANYVQIFKEKYFLRYIFNSSLVTIAGVVLTLVFSILAGYAFATMKFKGKKQLFAYMIITLIIPSQVTMLPLYIIMKHMNLLNTYFALILPIPTAVGVLIVRNSILSIPKELIEAAKIDGCSDFAILNIVVLPLIWSAVMSVSIFTFVGAWNEFLWPLIATTDESVRTLTVGLSSMKAQYTVNYGLVMAGATVTFLPSFIIYILLQRQFVEGVSMTGLKG